MVPIDWPASSLPVYPVTRGSAVVDELWILRDAAGWWRWQMRDQYGVTIEQSSTHWLDSGLALASARVKFGFVGYRVRVGRG